MMTIIEISFLFKFTELYQLLNESFKNAYFFEREIIKHDIAMHALIKALGMPYVLLVGYIK